MGSPHTGSDKVLEIRTAYVDVVIKSKGRQEIVIDENSDRSSSLRVVSTDLERVSVPAQKIYEEYPDHKGIAFHEYSVIPLFFEQTDFLVTIRSRNQKKLDFHSNSSLIEERINYVIDDDPTLLSGVVNFGSNVGFCDFIIFAGDKQILSFKVEVYPMKISYKEDYREMMTDIDNMVSESILDFMRKTYQVFVPDHKRSDVPVVFFAILQAVYRKYIQAVKRIMAVPHHRLDSEHEILPHYKAQKTDYRSEKWLEKHPEYIKKVAGSIKAEKLLCVRKQVTYDTQENRLVKFMLRSTEKRIEDFLLRYEKIMQKPDEKIVSGVKRMESELRRLLTTTFLTEVSEYNVVQSMSLVFGMAPGYRELYKYYLMLQNGISVGGDIFHISVRETAQLYEYWCFIKLYDILRNHYTLKSPDIIKVDRKGVTVDLVRGKSSKVTFLNTKTGERIFLSYNPSESVTQTVNQRPDNVLELEKKGSSTAYKYVFDAKYRIEMHPDGNFYPDSKPGPKVEDINTMHRYRDSIVYENPESRFTFEKTMFGAYILFPYAEEEEYRDHRFYKSIENVNIGGLPFLPSATSLVTKLLDELISDSSESAFERATLPVGIEKRLMTVEWGKREVLIGLVPDQNHMDIFLQNKLYFTRRFDVVNLPVQYIALYEKNIGILYYGEVISWHRETRHKLPGNSKYGNHQYHVFDVLKWKKLERTIAVSEYGPNPIAYTNFFLLNNSSFYSELSLRSEADYRFFTELKRRTDKAIIDKSKESTIFEFGDAKVLIDKSNIYVLIAEKLVETHTVQEFMRHPNAVFRQIQRHVGDQS